MHNGTTADGNKWLSRNLPTILNSAEYKNGSTAIFVTWDEGEGGHYAKGEHCAANTSDVSCHIATLVISPSTKKGARSGTRFSHYLPARYHRAAPPPVQAGAGRPRSRR